MLQKAPNELSRFILIDLHDDNAVSEMAQAGPVEAHVPREKRGFIQSLEVNDYFVIL